MKSDPNPVSTNNIDFENKIEFGHYGTMKRNDTAQHFQLISESDTGTWCRKRNHLEIAVHFGSTRSSAVALTSVSMVRLRQITDRAGSLVNHPGEAWSPKKGKKKTHNVHVRVAPKNSRRRVGFPRGTLFFSFLFCIGIFFLLDLLAISHSSRHVLGTFTKWDTTIQQFDCIDTRPIPPNSLIYFWEIANGDKHESRFTATALKSLSYWTWWFN